MQWNEGEKENGTAELNKVEGEEENNGGRMIKYVNTRNKWQVKGNKAMRRSS